MTKLGMTMGLGLLLLASCAKTERPSVGGETNWLVRCSADEPCATGSCLCGVCTRTCGDDAACGGDFAGVCVDAAHGAVANACAGLLPDQRPEVAAVCLPRCADDAACGKGFSCREGACVPEPITTGSSGSGGSGGSGGAISTGGGGGSGGSGSVEPDATVPDACVSDACVPTRVRPLIDQVVISRAVWDSLAVDGGDTYWYEEENCGGPIAGGGGTVQAIQVESGVARALGERSIPQAECTGGIGRYGDLEALTVPMLYDLCRSVILAADEANAAAIVRTDERGVIQECSWPWQPEHPGCFDSCGEGFVLQRWSFGTPGDEQDAGAR